MLKDYLYISEKPAKGNHAGNKARDDIDNILADIVARKAGFYECKNFKGLLDKIAYILNPENIKNIVQISFLKDKRIIMQYPFYCDFITKFALMKCVRNNEICLVIHDVDSLRNFGNDTTTQEVALFNQCHKLIVHNTKMAEALTSLGVKTQMINLQLFDYLRNSSISKKHELDNTIAFAGNLAKSKFLRNDLDSLGIAFNLYGPNFDVEKIKSKCVKYNGSFLPDEVPKEIDGSFGLIWDGESLDTCSGEYGNYMKYNNPHKLSLYISAGLPVIVWKNAAIADFVLSEGIGFLVDRLSDIQPILSTMTTAKYHEYLMRINVLQEKVIDGEYTRNSIALL